MSTDSLALSLGPIIHGEAHGPFAIAILAIVMIALVSAKT